MNDNSLTDDMLLDFIADAFTPDPATTDRLTMLARRAWEWGAIDAELGELIDDSLLANAGLRLFESDERVLAWRFEQSNLEVLVRDSNGAVNVQVIIEPDEATTYTVTSVVNDQLSTVTYEQPDGMLSFVTTAGTLTSIGLRRATRDATTGWFRP